MNIQIHEIDQNSLSQLNQCDNSFLVEHQWRLYRYLVFKTTGKIVQIGYQKVQTDGQNQPDPEIYSFR